MATTSQSKKRKRPATASTLTSVFSLSADLTADHTPPVPILASAGAVSLPTDVSFTQHSHQHDATRTLLYGESTKVEWESTNWRDGKRGDSEYSCSYILCLHRKSKATTVILPVEAHTLSPTVKALKAIKPLEATSDTHQLQKERLGTTFGTRKAIRAINNTARNTIDVESVDLQALQPVLQSAIDASTSSLPTIEAVNREAAESRNIPRYNSDATEPQGIYPMDNVVPPAELAAVPLSNIIGASSHAARIAALPFKGSEYINTRLKALFSDADSEGATLKAKEKRQIRMLWYANAIMAFRSRRTPLNGSAEARLANSNVPSIIASGLVDRFCETARGSAGPQVTATMADKLISYLFVLCLWIDDFSVDVGVVANDLKMTVKKTGEFFRSLGCVLSTQTPGDRERQLSASQASGVAASQTRRVKMAVLKTPLTFPKPKKGPTSRGR